MREDECRIRGDGAKNMAVMCRITFNQLQRVPAPKKKNLKAKQLKACMNNEYLEQLL